MHRPCLLLTLLLILLLTLLHHLPLHTFARIDDTITFISDTRTTVHLSSFGYDSNGVFELDLTDYTLDHIASTADTQLPVKDEYEVAFILQRSRNDLPTRISSSETTVNAETTRQTFPRVTSYVDGRSGSGSGRGNTTFSVVKDCYHLSLIAAATEQARVTATQQLSSFNGETEFLILPLPLRTYSSFHKTINITTPGFYHTYFSNCEPQSRVSIGKIYTVQYNVNADSTGERYLPGILIGLCCAFIVLSLVWRSFPTIVSRLKSVVASSWRMRQILGVTLQRCSVWFSQRPRCCSHRPHMACACCRNPLVQWALRSFLMLFVVHFTYVLIAAVVYSHRRSNVFYSLDMNQMQTEHLAKLTSSQQSLMQFFQQSTAAAAAAAEQSPYNPTTNLTHAALWNDSEDQHHPALQGESVKVAAAAADKSTAAATLEKGWWPHTEQRESTFIPFARGLCIVIVTVQREMPYFLQTLSSLLHSLSPMALQESNIYIINAHRPPNHHAGVVWLETTFERLRQQHQQQQHHPSSTSSHIWDRIHIVNIEQRRTHRQQLLTGSSGSPFSESFHFQGGWHLKETFDYLEALDICYEHHANATMADRVPTDESTQTSSVLPTSDSLSFITQFYLNPSAARSAHVRSADALRRIQTIDNSSSSHNGLQLCLMLEDDVMVTHDLLHKLQRGLQPILPHHDTTMADKNTNLDRQAESEERFVHARHPLPGEFSGPLADWVRWMHSWWTSSRVSSWRPGSSMKGNDEYRPWAYVRLFLSDYWNNWEIEDLYLTTGLLPRITLAGGILSLLACLLLDWMWRVAKVTLCVSADHYSSRMARPDEGLHRDDIEEQSQEDLEMQLKPLLHNDNDSFTSTSAPVSHGSLARRTGQQTRFLDAQGVDVAAAETLPHHDAITSHPAVSSSSTTLLHRLLHVAHNTSVLPRCDSTLPEESSSRFGSRCGSSRIILFVSLFSVFLCGGGLSLLSVVLIGKPQLYLGDWLPQTAQHLERGLHPLTPEDHVAGTQAVLYTQALLPEFIDYVTTRFQLLQNQMPPIDVLLNNFAADRRYDQLHLTPDLVQHMGSFSSAPHKNKGTLRTLHTSSSFVP